MSGLTGPRASIVIPVHNEGSTVATFLERLRDQGVLADYEVIVACNGCTDETFELARSFEGIVVGATQDRGKAAGLNLGDRLATVYPRIYIDVDVVISKAAIDAVVETLKSTDALAAAPRLEIDLDSRSWAVRAYYKVWMALAWSKEEMVGSGFYAASEVGRSRFEEFPNDLGLADDFFFSSHFTASERCAINDHVFTVPSSASVRELVSRKARILTLNAHTTVYTRSLAERPRGRSTTLRIVLSSPSLWLASPVFLGVAGVARVASWNRLRKREFRWTGSRIRSR